MHQSQSMKVNRTLTEGRIMCPLLGLFTYFRMRVDTRLIRNTPNVWQQITFARLLWTADCIEGHAQRNVFCLAMLQPFMARWRQWHQAHPMLHQEYILVSQTDSLDVAWFKSRLLIVVVLRQCSQYCLKTMLTVLI